MDNKFINRFQELIDDKEALNDVKIIIELNTKEVATELVEQYVIFNKQDIQELMEHLNKESIKDLIKEDENDTFKPIGTFDEFKKEVLTVWDQHHNNKKPKSRGCCKECGEGFDNEEEWLYNTECELCGEPIPEHLIIKKP